MTIVFTPIATVAGIVFLNETQQVLLKYRTSREVVNGPGTTYYNPFVCTSEVRDAVPLDEGEYTHVLNQINGSKSTVAGPMLFFPGAHDLVFMPRPASA